MGSVETGTESPEEIQPQVVLKEVIMIETKSNVDPENRGVEGLTEVLRLQAEALSRISERMAGMNPQAAGKVPPSATVKERPGDGMHLPVLAGDPSINEESLPVLNSFKQFLEQERRRGRKRFIWGLLGFTVVFSCVLGGIVWMNKEQDQALKADIQQTSTLLERTRKDAEAELKKVSDKTDKAAQSLAKNAASVRSDITRNILWAHSTLASNINSELNGRDTEIERLKEKVSTLEVDNTLLARQVDELARRLKGIETDFQDYMERSISESIKVDVKTPVGASSNVVSAAGISPLTINSAKFGRSMQMRVPNE